MTTVYDVPADLLISTIAKDLNENVVDEIKRQLKAHEIIKVKFSKSISSEKQNYITEITEKSKSKLIDLRGNVAVIYKKSPRTQSVRGTKNS